MSGYLLDAYQPPWWLRGPHAQTIGGRFLRRAPRLRLWRQRIQTPDGDFLDLDWTAPPERCGDAPRVVVLHGLEGSSRSIYVLNTLAALAARGAVGVALNFRSCGDELNRTARFYHAGETGDLARVLQHLREDAPEARLGAVGFSLGGNVLLKFLGEGGELEAAAAISVPFDLAAGADQLERGMGRVYASHFMRKLLRKARAKDALLGDACEVERVRAARTIREFDDAATAPLHGFRDAAHYYRESSSVRFLHRIRVPTLIIHALDDPFLPASSVPVSAIRSNPALVEAVVPRGGHVGFVRGAPWAPEFWAEQEAARFVALRLLGPG